MAKHVPDAGAYAPVTVLVDERPDGMHISYHRIASFLAPCGILDALFNFGQRISVLDTNRAREPPSSGISREINTLSRNRLGQKRASLRSPLVLCRRHPWRLCFKTFVMRYANFASDRASPLRLSSRWPWELGRLLPFSVWFIRSYCSPSRITNPAVLSPSGKK